MARLLTVFPQAPEFLLHSRVLPLLLLLLLWPQPSRSCHMCLLGLSICA